MLQLVASVDISDSLFLHLLLLGTRCILLWNGNQNNVFMLIYESIYSDRCPAPAARCPLSDLHVIHALKTMNDSLCCAPPSKHAKLFSGQAQINDFRFSSYAQFISNAGL